MRLYLAGPDVFRPDARSWAAEARALCAGLGHQALIPLDNEESTATGIYHGNIAMLRGAEGVIANLNPFRGHEPDSGTCVEVGFALALGKPVVGYIQDGRPQVEKLLPSGQPPRLCQGRPLGPDGLFVEDFGYPVNLMLGVPLNIVVGDLGTALRHFHR